MPIHIEKKAIRALGIAESFSQTERISTLAGIVMRSDLIVDGFGLGVLEVSGSDATQSVISLFKKLRRNDINVILLSGSVLSLYNIVDVETLFKEVAKPVIALTFKKSQSDLATNIQTRFSKSKAEAKIRLLRKLGVPKRLMLKTGYYVFIRAEGVSDEEAKGILDKFTLQGAVPEPVRVARLFAKVVASYLRDKRK